MSLARGFAPLTPAGKLAREKGRKAMAEVTEKKKKSGSEKRQKGAVITFRATAAELEEIDCATAKAGLSSRSEYARRQCLARPKARRPTVAVELLAQVLGQLGKVGGNLNQIAHRLNANLYVSRGDLSATLDELRQVCREIVKVLGKGGGRGDSD